MLLLDTVHISKISIYLYNSKNKTTKDYKLTMLSWWLILKRRFKQSFYVRILKYNLSEEDISNRYLCSTILCSLLRKALCSSNIQKLLSFWQINHRDFNFIFIFLKKSCITFTISPPCGGDNTTFKSI